MYPMPRYRKPERRWPKLLFIIIPVLLIAAVVLVAPLPKHINATVSCQSITADGTIADGGTATLDLWHMQYLLRDDSFTGTVVLPNGMKTVKTNGFEPFVDTNAGILQTHTLVYDPIREDMCSLVIYTDENFSKWLFRTGDENRRRDYLVTEEPIENPEELNTLFEGFLVWP